MTSLEPDVALTSSKNEAPSYAFKDLFHRQENIDIGTSESQDPPANRPQNSEEYDDERGWFPDDFPRPVEVLSSLLLDSHIPPEPEPVSTTYNSHGTSSQDFDHMYALPSSYTNKRKCSEPEINSSDQQLPGLNADPDQNETDDPNFFSSLNCQGTSRATENSDIEKMRTAALAKIEELVGLLNTASDLEIIHFVSERLNDALKVAKGMQCTEVEHTSPAGKAFDTQDIHVPTKGRPAIKLNKPSSHD
ncbi:hypothetical protein C0Q70_09999 [Pomacea canaliculata]|uniref:Uncharacterized protein n=1 Tax=Pomacea canaliculata TaxID=400727 RepID=A0A2T7PBC2_POMCA|nr:hypothetical protein C0Q70_09999 [Pomacea canaliculata]